MISYDIENDRMRVKVAQLLIRWGLHRVQYSVFLGSVSKEKVLSLFHELEHFRAEKAWVATNSIMIIPIHRSQVKSIRMIGTWPNRWEEMTGEKNTLIF